MATKRKKLTTSYELLLQQFLEYLQAQGYREATVQGYGIRLPFFLYYLQEQKIAVVDVTRHHIQGYSLELAQRNSRFGKPLTVGTRHRDIGQIKVFFRYLHKSGRIYHDPSANIELPRKGTYLPRSILSIDEVKSIMEQPDLSTPLGIRNRAILELMYSCGLRNGEVTRIEEQDIDIEDRTLYVKGKGGRDGVIPFGKEAALALENYAYFARRTLLSARGTGRSVSRQRKEETLQNNPFFLTAQGYRMVQGTLIHMVKRYALLAEIDKPVTPHTFRHACATHLLRNGADIRLIQRLLRHADITNTQLYTHVSAEDLKEAQQKFHPRELFYASGS